MPLCLSLIQASLKPLAILLPQPLNGGLTLFEPSPYLTKVLKNTFPEKSLHNCSIFLVLSLLSSAPIPHLQRFCSPALGLTQQGGSPVPQAPCKASWKHSVWPQPAAKHLLMGPAGDGTESQTRRQARYTHPRLLHNRAEAPRPSGCL